MPTGGAEVKVQLYPYGLSTALYLPTSLVSYAMSGTELRVRCYQAEKKGQLWGLCAHPTKVCSYAICYASAGTEAKVCSYAICNAYYGTEAMDWFATCGDDGALSPYASATPCPVLT
eukprot:1504193-Rhodomonas_salina.1